MGESSRNSRRGSEGLLKMHELDNAYREFSARDRELTKYRKLSQDAKNDLIKGQDRDKEITKLQYMVSKLEDRMKIAKGEVENGKRDLKNEIEERKAIEKKLSVREKENKDLRTTIGALRVKLGLANANYNVGKRETEELRKGNQDNQIQIARLEERLLAANNELKRLRDPLIPEGSEEGRKETSAMSKIQVKKKVAIDKKELKKLRTEIDQMRETREDDRQRLVDKDVELRELHNKIAMDRETISYLEHGIELAENNLEVETTSREKFQAENRELLKAKEAFDEQIRSYKVKLGRSTAKKNVNVREAEELRKKDEEHRCVVQNLEKRLHLANVEIEKLKSNVTMMQRTADSTQEHRSRYKTHRSGYGMEFVTPRHLESSQTGGGRRSSGWSPAITPSRTPARSPQRSPGPGAIHARSRISINSVNSLTSHNGTGKTPSAHQNRKTPGTAL